MGDLSRPTLAANLGPGGRQAFSLDVVEALAESLPTDRVRVAESGIKGHDDIVRLGAAGYDAFLIGEHLVRAEDPEIALRRLLGGEDGS